MIARGSKVEEIYEWASVTGATYQYAFTANGQASYRSRTRTSKRRRNSWSRWSHVNVVEAVRAIKSTAHGVSFQPIAIECAND